ncbi:hypothetical protein DSCW_38160 [Desulfosarcina widdelii]|uniref:Yip1 domain-containing protein n=1 Tax=Desulfosarcina widdelii TaxID=947919 RepID=A0A5K7Z8A8_9BACT|nr:hypothetical protein [Desulfosarcina widdelii]BBO76399.1 hypothetical protein DSCW_38160 [Desulfosarcina widdelii]
MIYKSQHLKAFGYLSLKGMAMDYLRHMMRILKLDATVYDELAAGGLPMRYCMINVTVLGLIYGLASTQFAKQLLAAKPDAAVAFNPLMILMVGISIAFFMHGGLSLFVWVFCRGIGGNPQFMPTYLYIGMSALALWPLAPAVSAFQAGLTGGALNGYAAAAVLYGAAVIFVAVKAASQLSPVKMTLAALATMVYIGCFLYLWL